MSCFFYQIVTAIIAGNKLLVWLCLGKKNEYCWMYLMLLSFLQGGKIRSQLVSELSGANDVVIEEGTAGEAGKAAAQNGMRKWDIWTLPIIYNRLCWLNSVFSELVFWTVKILSWVVWDILHVQIVGAAKCFLLFVRSIFCLSPAGDTPSSARLFDAIVSGCIPVIVSDELELPFEGFIDYRKVWITTKHLNAIMAILVFHRAFCFYKYIMYLSILFKDWLPGKLVKRELLPQVICQREN